MTMGGCSSSIFILVMFSVVNLLFNGNGINGLNEEGAALLSFKASMTEDPGGSLANWNSSDPTPCAWNGVTCNKGGNVVSLTLVRNSLKGPLPLTITSLSSLRRINLRNNRLLGNIPPALFRSSPSLHTLVLSMNSLSGPLPPDLPSLKSLRVLDLSHNSLQGSIPLSFTHQCCCCTTTRLRTLILSHNNFTGPLPFGLGNTFISLERIDLSYNSFTGSIPDDIGNLSSLDSAADFSHNLFSGSVPATLGSLPEKVYVDLSYNNLTGTIPQSGSLANRGPAAFAGNPGLCGPPLKNACVVPPPRSKGISSNVSDVTTSSRRLSRSVVNALIAGDLVGIAVVATAFCYLYRRRRAVSSKETGKKGGLRKGLMAKECFCLRKGEADSSSAENLGQTNLIPLDRKVNFSLNELLQSTAFVLGKSEFGIVYKVVMGDRSTLAVRRLGEGGSQRFNEFQREVEAIGRVRHSNIVALRAYYWSIEEKLLIYDYIPGGNLSTAIHGRDGDSTFSPLLWSSRLKIMKGVAKGLAFLHESSPKKYVHGDLKPRNVLLGLNMMPYISDFGLGRLAYIAEGSNPERAQNQFSDAAVSPVTSSRLCYHAPEAFRSTKPSQKWDIYSFGVILLELISGQSPVLLLDTQEMDLVQWFQFCISERKPLVDVLDPYLAQEPEIEDEIITVLKIALACVESNPERRPSMKLVAESLERSITRS